MSKYICTICGFVYDEALGESENNIKAGTKWDDIAKDWKCSLCGAEKRDFEVEEKKKAVDFSNEKINQVEMHELRELSSIEMSALFSNLAKGSEKQYRLEEEKNFSELAEYYKNISASKDNKKIKDIDVLIKKDLNDGFPKAEAVAKDSADRGALRSIVWASKVTKISASILSRYDKQKTELLKDKNIYVCDICGFIYIGDEPPAICPVCKVPKEKIIKVEREAI